MVGQFYSIFPIHFLGFVLSWYLLVFDILGRLTLAHLVNKILFYLVNENTFSSWYFIPYQVCLILSMEHWRVLFINIPWWDNISKPFWINTHMWLCTLVLVCFIRSISYTSIWKLPSSYGILYIISTYICCRTLIKHGRIGVRFYRVHVH